jgi:hypothetical protein
MSVFWQHVGDANLFRDGPRTIGTPYKGLREFTLSDIEPHLSPVSPPQAAEMKRNFERISDTKFQIWGLPTGAVTALSKAQPGDYLMLLDSNAEWGGFRYIGELLYKLPQEHWQLSSFLWKESKFPLIVLLRGNLIAYPWEQFLSDFQYGAGFRPMGRTYRISAQAFSRGPATTDQGFLDYVVAHYPPPAPH